MGVELPDTTRTSTTTGGAGVFICRATGRLRWAKPTHILIGPGDSGGAALKRTANGWELVGIDTFTEGYGGRFGDTGGGVLVNPYKDWILQTTGIPEPGCAVMLMLALLVFMLRHSQNTAATLLKDFH